MYNILPFKASDNLDGTEKNVRFPLSSSSEASSSLSFSTHFPVSGCQGVCIIAQSYPLFPPLSSTQQSGNIEVCPFFNIINPSVPCPLFF
jgi:hypothetical protein